MSGGGDLDQYLDQTILSCFEKLPLAGSSLSMTIESLTIAKPFRMTNAGNQLN